MFFEFIFPSKLLCHETDFSTQLNIFKRKNIARVFERTAIPHSQLSIVNYIISGTLIGLYLPSKQSNMKRSIIAILAGFIAFSAAPARAQINVSVNLGSQPTWGPTGYNRAEYYYLPDIETYYYVPKRQFIYRENDKWLFMSALPSRYRGYDLNNGYKVVMNTSRPYQYFSSHKMKYAKYKGYKGKQSIIRNSNDLRYSKGNSGKSHSNESNGKSGGKGKN